jgi:hypothetical protein
MSQTKAMSQTSPSASQIQGDPEVVVRAQRRQFSMAGKQRILAEADACQKARAIGAPLRQEGIYSSYLTQWRRERAVELFGGRLALNGAGRGR